MYTHTCIHANARAHTHIHKHAYTHIHTRTQHTPLTMKAAHNCNNTVVALPHRITCCKIMSSQISLSIKDKPQVQMI